MLDFAESTVDYTSYSATTRRPSGARTLADAVSGRDSPTRSSSARYVQDKVTSASGRSSRACALDVAERALRRQPASRTLLLGGPSGRMGLSYAITDEHRRPRVRAATLVQLPSTIDAPVAARVLSRRSPGRPLPVDLKAEKDWSGELGVAGRLWRKATARRDRLGTARQRPARSSERRARPTSSRATTSQRGRALGAEVSAVASPARIVTVSPTADGRRRQGRGGRVRALPVHGRPSSPTRAGVCSTTCRRGPGTWASTCTTPAATTHLSGLVSYGSGLRTGADRHPERPLSHDVRRHASSPVRLVRCTPRWRSTCSTSSTTSYAYRIGTGYVGSAYGPLRRVMVRLSVPFTG